MRKVYLILAGLLAAHFLFAQKPSLTPEVFDWPRIFNEKISNDGQVVLYSLHKNSVEEDTLVIQYTDKHTIEKIPGGVLPVITADSRFILFRKKDNLFLYDIQQRKMADTINQIVSFKTPEAENGHWIAWLQRGNKLTVCDCNKNRRYNYDNITDYRFSRNGKVLLLQSKEIDGSDTVPVIRWVELAASAIFTVLKPARNARYFAFDEAARQLAFVADNTLWYYAKGMESAVVQVNKNTPGLDSNYVPDNSAPRFSPNGKRIFFPIRKKQVAAGKIQPDAADINVWHFNDDYLVTERLVNKSFDANRTWTAVIQPDQPGMLQIDQEMDDRFIELAGDGDYDYALLKNNRNFFAGKWKASTMPAYVLCNIRTGERKQIITKRDLSVYMSPAGKYVVWFDPESGGWFSYENETGRQTAITTQLAGTFISPSQEMALQPFMPFGIAGWLANDKALFIYDEFDIWQIDPKAEKAPVNITNGYGKKHHIILRLWQKGKSDYSMPVIGKEPQVLVAFDIESKANGFFTTSFTRAADPARLSLDPCLYYPHLQFRLPVMQHYPITKAKSASAFILRRMNSQEYPNIFFSKDLKQFTTLSDIHPQKDYNWLTSEPINWKQSDGSTGQGILYKPENFDPSKKYPVIFYLYEKWSYKLHQFIEPELSFGGLNIPYFVSNGYLICTPDISYMPGSPGESALKNVLTAAYYVAQLPYIDSTKMGLQGHSFGGYEVNYIVSHTSLFAAAQESAGASDFISYYNGFYREHSAQFYFEYGQGRIGHTLWETPELYIRNSPIFKADQVKTPLLIMHNKEDGEVPFQQGLEWFTALRRLGKKVWMLQYDKEHHSIDQPKNQLDFTIRMKTFFDHFLKGAPPPDWLTNSPH